MFGLLAGLRRGALPTGSADIVRSASTVTQNLGMGTSAVTVSKAGGGVAVVTLAKEPVNSMNLDLWRQLQGALDQCEQDPEVRSKRAHAWNVVIRPGGGYVLTKGKVPVCLNMTSMYALDTL